MQLILYVVLPSHVNVSQQKQFHSQVFVLHQKITLCVELSQIEDVGRTNQAIQYEYDSYQKRTANMKTGSKNTFSFKTTSHF